MEHMLVNFTAKRSVPSERCRAGWKKAAHRKHGIV